LIPATYSDDVYASSIELEPLHHSESEDHATRDKTNHRVHEFISVRTLSDESHGGSHGEIKGNKKSRSHTPSWLYSQRLHAYWTNGWIPETVSCGLSFIALVCLIATLRYFEGHSLTDMPLKININTLVAVFAAVIKSSLLLPVAEGTVIPGGNEHN